MWSEAFVIEGPPRTKKTSQRIIVNRRTGKPMILPARTSSDWEHDAAIQLRCQWFREHGTESIELPVAVRAIVYRDRRVGDWTGYMQAIADALERSGVIKNDRQIRHWDGSRLDADRDRPRVELTVTVDMEDEYGK